MECFIRNCTNENAFQRIRQQINEELGRLPIGKVSFLKGRGEQYGLFFWWRITLNNNVILRDEYKDYNGIHLMPYYVGEELFICAKSHEHMKSKAAFPNYDAKSGNLHPVWNSKSFTEWLEAPSIKQVILVNNKNKHWGPLNNASSNIEKFSDIAVSPDCYYPSPTEKVPHETESLGELLNGLLVKVLSKQCISKFSIPK